MKKLVSRILIAIMCVSVIVTPVLYNKENFEIRETEWSESGEELHAIELFVEDYGDEIP